MGLSIMSSDADVEWAIREVLAIKPLGHYMRWQLELSRRRFAKLEADMKVAKTAYDAVNKTVVLKTKAEADAHDKAFREAQSKYSLERNCWICSVGNAKDMLQTAKLFDELADGNRRKADDDMPSFRFLMEAPEGSPEDKRNKALQEAERQYHEECEDVRADCASFYRGSFERGRSSAMRSGFADAQKTYEKAITEAEEAYYRSCLGL